MMKKHSKGPWKRENDSDPMFEGHTPVGSNNWGAMIQVVTKMKLDMENLTGGMNEEGLANLVLVEQAPAMDLMLEAVRRKMARFDGDEFCIGGLRYSIRNDDYSAVVDCIGWERLERAINEWWKHEYEKGKSL